MAPLPAGDPTPFPMAPKPTRIGEPDHSWLSPWGRRRQAPASAIGRGWSATVVEPPHATGAAGCAGSAFHKHSRTVIMRVSVLMVTTWNDSFRSFDIDSAPFIGESTRNVGRTTRLSGPIQS